MKLTNRELRILSHLAQGRTYRETREALGMTEQNMTSSCHYIREKAGITETRDAQECARYLAKVPPETLSRALNERQDGWKHIRGETPTDNQIEVLRLIARGQNYRQIAAFLGTTPQSVQNLACRACKRVGIQHAGWNRTRYIREWVKENFPHDADSNHDPMDDPAF